MHYYSDIFIHNNCMAMLAGLRDYDLLNTENGRTLVGCSGFDGTEDGFEKDDILSTRRPSEPPNE